MENMKKCEMCYLVNLMQGVKNNFSFLEKKLSQFSTQPIEASLWNSSFVIPSYFLLYSSFVENLSN